MANLYFYVDKRSTRKDGKAALKIALSHNRKTVYYSLGMFVNPDNFDAAEGIISPKTKYRFQNAQIANTMSRLQILLANVSCKQSCNSLSARELLDLITVEAGYKEELKSKSDGVLQVYEEYISLCKKKGTAQVYRASLNNLKLYDSEMENLKFDDINEAWLMRYQNWLLDEENGRGMSVNGANVYLRNLRRIFNYAINNKRTSARYPFKDDGVDMTTIDPDKMPIPYEKFLEWATMPMPDYRGFYRDLFMLSFYLCGMRPVDLLHVKKEQVEDGRLVYYPQKLNGRTKLSIKIEPEAEALIKKYEGREYLINVMETRSDYKTFLKHWNEGLRAIGEDVLGQKKGRSGRTYTTVQHKSVVPYITVYYARTCFATYSFNVANIPIDTISQAMGHKNGLKVTNFYVKRDTSLVDKANRNMIDRLTKDMAEYAQKKGWLE